MTQKPRNLEDDLNALARELAPQRSLAADVMRRLHNQSQPATPTQSPLTRRWIMRTSIGIAAAALLTATLLLLLTPPHPAFAQVLQKIETTKSMSCDFNIDMDDHQHLLIRADMIRAEAADGTVAIGNRKTGQWIALNLKNRTAMRIAMAPQRLDLYAWFRDFKDGKEEPLGDKTMDGRKVIGFRILRSPLNATVSGNVPLTIWVDALTSLPVEAESSSDGHSLHVTNFQWDQPLDEKLFAMDIPEGYKIQDIGGVSATQLAPPPTTQEAANLTLHPGAGIGDLKFGDDPDRVTAILGKPEKISNNVSWEYPSKGLYLTVNPKQGLLIIMAASKQAFPMFNVNDFPGKLDNGLTIGDSRDDIEKAYGKPDRSESAGTNSVMIHYVRTNVDFTLLDNKVTQIYLQLPQSARDAIRAKLATQPK